MKIVFLLIAITSITLGQGSSNFNIWASAGTGIGNLKYFNFARTMNSEFSIEYNKFIFTYRNLNTERIRHGYVIFGKVRSEKINSKSALLGYRFNLGVDLFDTGTLYQMIGVANIGVSKLSGKDYLHWDLAKQSWPTKPYNDTGLTIGVDFLFPIKPLKMIGLGLGLYSTLNHSDSFWGLKISVYAGDFD